MPVSMCCCRSMGQFNSSEVWQSSALDLINEFGGRDAATGRPVATVENVTLETNMFFPPRHFRRWFTYLPQNRWVICDRFSPEGIQIKFFIRVLGSKNQVNRRWSTGQQVEPLAGNIARFSDMELPAEFTREPWQHGPWIETCLKSWTSSRWMSRYVINPCQAYKSSSLRSWNSEWFKLKWRIVWVVPSEVPWKEAFLNTCLFLVRKGGQWQRALTALWQVPFACLFEDIGRSLWQSK